MEVPFTLLRCAVVLALACVAASDAGAATAYSFKPLLPPNAWGNPPDLVVPALADDGRVAFGGKVRGAPMAVMRARPGRVPTVIAAERRFSRFGNVSISARGHVAFEGSLEHVTGEGIFRGSGNEVTQIAGTRDAGDFDFVRTGPSVDFRGRVAFSGERIVNGRYVDGVYVGDGNSILPFYDTDGLFRDFTGNPALDDNGLVAFLATLKNGVGGLFLGNGAQEPVKVADDTGILTGIVGFSDPSLNNRAEVAFMAGTNPDVDDNGSSTGAGIFLYTGGVLTTVVQGGFTEYFSLGEPSLNNYGKVAFVVEPTYGNKILVTGPDLVEDRVIGTGDVLRGRVVSSIAFSRDGFNDAGQLAFIAFFEDGSSAPFVATPVP